MKNAGHRAGRDLGNAFRRLKRVNDEDFTGVYDDDDVAYDDYEDDEDFNPYIGYGPEDDPNWGYDNFDDDQRNMKPVPDISRYRNSRANNYVDYMRGNPRDSKNNSANRYVDDTLARSPEERLRRLGRDPHGITEYEDGTRTIGTHRDTDPEQWEQGPTSNNHDEEAHGNRA